MQSLNDRNHPVRCGEQVGIGDFTGIANRLQGDVELLKGHLRRVVLAAGQTPRRRSEPLHHHADKGLVSALGIGEPVAGGPLVAACGEVAVGLLGPVGAGLQFLLPGKEEDQRPDQQDIYDDRYDQGNLGRA